MGVGGVDLRVGGVEDLRVGMDLLQVARVVEGGELCLLNKQVEVGQVRVRHKVLRVGMGEWMGGDRMRHMDIRGRMVNNSNNNSNSNSSSSNMLLRMRMDMGGGFSWRR